MDRGVASSSTILTCFCFLLFFFTFASARYPFDSSEVDIDHTNHDSFPVPRRHLPLSFRLGHRCHHNHYYKPWKSRLPRREDHVMLNNVEGKDYDPVARGGVRQIPAGWMRFRHVEPMLLSHEHTMAMGKIELLRRLYNRGQHESENKDNTGLMKRIRKFLKNF